MEKAVTQEDMMGCGIACVAFSLRKSYQKTKTLFEKPASAVSRGYYCREIADVLNKNGLKYSFSKVNEKNKNILKKEGVIVFIERCKKYPKGHYLIRTKNGWMNPWINYPNIVPVKSGFQNKLPARATWMIYPSTNNL